MIEPRDIPLPRLPQPPQPYTFPVLATLAPVLASLGMWAVTRSPFALMFAVLGPLVAVGSLVDSRVQGRRRLHRELARFEADAAATGQHIDREHARLRQQLWRASRATRMILPGPLHDAERWRYGGGEVPVVVGVGRRASGVRPSGATPPESESRPVAGVQPRRPSRWRDGRGRRDAPALVADGIRALRSRAAVIDGVPIAFDARLGIGICGGRVPALAVARAVVVQLADALPPGRFVLRGAFEAWHRALPHHGEGGGDAVDRLDFVAVDGRGAAGEVSIAVVVAERAEQLPRECRIGLEVCGGELRVLRHPQLGSLDRDGVPAVPRTLRADLVSQLEADRFAETLAAAARAEGIGGQARSLPDSVALGDIWGAVAAAAGGLPATFLVGADGPVVVDLVADGPHAVVGGTTGSGKSELLIGWVLAMARLRSPRQLCFLLVDFKGGSSFGAVAGIPHSVGLITDLDHASAARALDSLRAELRHREQVLAAAGARAIDDLDAAEPELPRLVVVVDEFAAMVADFPELHAVFADIAARGRSLGVHLILCTQRPGGVVRDAVMANCTLRLSLRVNNAPDSVAVIGTDAAGSLPRTPVGRCLLSIAGAEPSLVQVALGDDALAHDLAVCWSTAGAPRRPWLPPLPAIVPLDDLPAASDGVVFGLLDSPETQQQPAAVWSFESHGHLLAIGGQRSGRSTVLEALAKAAAPTHAIARLGPDLEQAWDVLEALLARGGDDAGTLVLADDLDALIARFPEQYSPAFLERVTTLLRDGPALGLRVAASVARLTSSVQSLAPLFDSRLLLRLPTRQEHVMAGGDGSHHDPAAPAGRGRWRGSVVQVALPPPAGPPRTAAPTRRPLVLVDHAGALAVVTSRPAAITESLTRRGLGERLCGPAEAPSRAARGERPIAVGDVAAWQAGWGSLGALRQHGGVVFDGCSPSDFRVLSGLAILPPPLSRLPGAAWLLLPGGEVERIHLVIS